jgi:O-antigen ligase
VTEQQTIQPPSRFANAPRSGTFFCVGLALVLLSLLLAIPPVWDTFIHLWRVEFVASLFLTVTLISAFIFRKELSFSLDNISDAETKLVILPMTAFILWSGISMIWAPSWRSALHHTLIWSEYLIFYLAVRHLLDRFGNFGKLLNTITFALAFLSVLAVFSYCVFLIFGSVTTQGITYAKYGEQVNTVFPLFLVSILRLRGKRFALGLSILVGLWLLVFCSLSRTNLMLFTYGIAAIIAFVFLIKRFRPYRRRLALVVAVLVFAPVPLHVFSLLSTNPEVPFVSRVSDSAGISSSNNFRKLMLSVGEEMIKAHPTVGIGADNFGFQTNNFRMQLGAVSPDDPNLAEAEDTIPERAHNEYLQITAELGIVGLGIFMWFIAGIGLMGYRAVSRSKHYSIFLIAAFTGLGLFLTSSLVTSYSFRLIQNGFVFFFVLAVAASRSFKRSENRSHPSAVPHSEYSLKFVFSAGIVLSLLLTTFTTIRVTSVAYASKANGTRDLNEALMLYKKAMWLDPENPEAPYFLGLRLMEKGRYTESAFFLADSIHIGKGRSADYSYLASAETLNGDTTAAEQTFAEAAKMYPRSPFVLTRYAALLKANGKTAESEQQLARARQINLNQANSWWAMINQSPQAAADLAFQRTDYTPLMDLRPQMSMYALKAEIDIAHPDEKNEMLMRTLTNH